MPFTLYLEQFAAIRTKIMRRKAETLAAEINAIDWDNQPHFQCVDDFLKFADTFME